MRIWIDTKELLLLLEQKKHEIGNSCIGNMAYILSGLTAIYSSYDTDKWIPRWLIDLLGIILIGTGGKGMYKVVTKKNYTQKNCMRILLLWIKRHILFLLSLLKTHISPMQIGFCCIEIPNGNATFS